MFASRKSALVAAAASCVIVFAATDALAWGDTGHRMIGTLAMEALPASVPTFLHAPGVAADVGEWAREPDRWRAAGLVHDDMRDPGHFVDVNDDGRVPDGPMLDQLPPSRGEYDAMLVKAGSSLARAGFLPYSIIDGWQQLVKDFALWRADVAGEKLEKDPAKRAWIVADRRRREQMTVIDLGIWAHYVGDGSQPLHVSVHYNGWGNGPNPHQFTTAPVHVPWEGPFVRANVSWNAVRAAMTPYEACGCAIALETERYLEATRATVMPFYMLEKGNQLKPSNTKLIDFTAGRVAAGASELRNLIVEAWIDSADGTVGYPVTSVRDIESGKVDAYDLLHGTD